MLDRLCGGPAAPNPQHSMVHLQHQTLSTVWCIINSKEMYSSGPVSPKCKYSCKALASLFLTSHTAAAEGDGCPTTAIAAACPSYHPRLDCFCIEAAVVMLVLGAGIPSSFLACPSQATELKGRILHTVSKYRQRYETGVGKIDQDVRKSGGRARLGGRSGGGGRARGN